MPALSHLERLSVVCKVWGFGLHSEGLALSCSVFPQLYPACAELKGDLSYLQSGAVHF